MAFGQEKKDYILSGKILESTMFFDEAKLMVQLKRGQSKNYAWRIMRIRE